MRHPRIARFAVTLLAVATLLPVFAAPAAAAIETVSGTIVLKEKIALSPTAVAVVTIGDRSPSGSGTIIGQQRIDGATANQAFSVPYDASTINKKHAYSVYASLIDSGKEWQSPLPIPTITGGPTSGLTVTVGSPSFTDPAAITGSISLPAGTVPTTSAVAYAVITNTTTGRVAARQVLPSPTLPISFTIGYDASLVDPDASYVINGALIDGTTLWQTATSTPVNPGDTPSLSLVQQSTTIPGASPLPTEGPPTAAPASPSAAPTEAPSAAPTKTPKPTPEVTAPPTEAPTAPPTEEPTAAPTAPPTEEPTAAPAESPSEIPSASPSEEPSPTSGPSSVSGTVIYNEPAQLTDQAVLTIVVIQKLGSGPTVTVVGEERMDNPGQQPIAFTIALDPNILDPNVEAQIWASLVDGTNAWTSADGVPVATLGNPSEGVVVPLTFRPDLIEGEVTGAITGLPSDISLSAWAMTWIQNPADGQILGLTTGPIYGSTLVPFEVPFLVADVDDNATYWALAAVFDDTRTWRSEAAVPVVTQGNPFTNVVITVVLAGPSPTPSAEATAVPVPTTAPTPAASATPAATAPPASTGGGPDLALILGVLALIVIGGAVVIFVMRR